MKKIFKFFLNLVPRPVLISLSYLVKPFFQIYYRGNSYEDPIDGKKFRSFLPYGYEHPRENVLSPSTLSLERHRLLWLFLKNDTDFFSAPLHVLHFAPEQAFYRRFKKLKNLNYVTTDLNSPLADVKADICNLPFNDDTFDVILCNHVLEHIPDDTKALKELYRVMKPGGWGIFQVPQELDRERTFEDNTIVDKVERAKIFGQYDHVRIYGKDYFNKLRSAGFTVTEIAYTNELSPGEIDRYRLAEGEIIPFVRK
ncbi:methyltransferase domain-containing protein [Maribacter confluentis]|uniref:Methyltransferase domain-containing protein n=1 Tax=Maribacter confluentis TaxID=1656093 RepID=A0ABT8RVM5_9FLAO|nr:class I SAM-dependent methyltransferase [Maribacter confluentis]MDO1511960.1 methyltransferase domain-containing protein [Maribacter confluentis]MDO1514941.1 methyltransferase domain-containing protein [Maribacter confluentis]MDO1514987.1 methyltransferase domain-containing protein [Maribacter confluentis]MDO1515001.1 methyltransferase domain-containing protein [Maribacter confluentis]